MNAPSENRFLSGTRQIARIDRLVREDGDARGTRLVRIVTGGGLEIEALPDRGLDIGTVAVDGIPVAWSAPAPPAGPARFEPDGQGWLRTFSGGLLVTCGLDTFGAASVDGGTPLGQHGRATALAAEHLSTTVPDLDEDPPELELSGTMRQGVLFGENLLWRRTISAPLGGRTLRVADRISNLGARPVPHLVLYHLNFGWPLVAPGAFVSTNPDPAEVTARDEASAVALDDWRSIPDAGSPDAPEQVLAHRLPAGTTISYRISNEELRLSAAVTVDAAELPWLYQWRLFRRREYVLALEPATADAIRGRAEAQGRGVVPFLEPGETRQTSITIGFDRLH